MASTPTTNTISGYQPMATWPVMAMLAVVIPPTSNRRSSAEKSWRSAFWMMIESPKVTSSGGSTPRSRMRASSARWIA